MKINKSAIRVLSVLVLFAGHSFGQNEISKRANRASCCKAIYPKTQWDSLDINRLGSDFRRLKSLNCDGCDVWGSDYQAILEYLGRKLNGSSKSEVIKVMGKPDEIDGKKYIYYWRGGHDYLYFEFVKKKAQSNWYYAYE